MLLMKFEEIYRVLVEVIVYGIWMIIEMFKESGVLIEELYVVGGIVEKNLFVMQIYVDVINMDIKIFGFL